MNSSKIHPLKSHHMSFSDFVLVKSVIFTLNSVQAINGILTIFFPQVIGSRSCQYFNCGVGVKSILPRRVTISPSDLFVKNAFSRPKQDIFAKKNSSHLPIGC